jgi:hypothetical protein
LTRSGSRFSEPTLRRPGVDGSHRQIAGVTTALVEYFETNQPGAVVVQAACRGLAHRAG